MWVSFVAGCSFLVVFSPHSEYLESTMFNRSERIVDLQQKNIIQHHQDRIVMRITQELERYLRGEVYTNSLQVSFQFEEEDYRYRTQIDLLSQLVKEKNVVHVGCVDHNSETIQHKLKRKKWLHARLCESAKRCHGVDIQEEGIRYIQNVLGLRDTSCADILSDEFAVSIAGQSWDGLLIPEVLEHFQDPTGFLSAVAQRYSKTFDWVAITVPNAFCRDNFNQARKGVETINSDHCLWFTPYTAAKMVYNAGLKMEKMLLCRHGTINHRSFIKKWYYRRNPLLRNDILCLARFC